MQTPIRFNSSFYKMNTTKLIENDVILNDTCVGAFYFSKSIPDFVEFVHDIKSWDFNEGAEVGKGST